MNEMIFGAIISGIIGIFIVLFEQWISRRIEYYREKKRKKEFFQELYEYMEINACEEAYCLIRVFSDEEKEWIRQMGELVKFNKENDEYGVFGYYSNYNNGYFKRPLFFKICEYQNKLTIGDFDENEEKKLKSLLSDLKETEKSFRNQQLYKFLKTLENVHKIKLSDKNLKKRYGTKYEQLKITEDPNFNIKDRRWG